MNQGEATIIDSQPPAMPGPIPPEQIRPWAEAPAQDERTEREDATGSEGFQKPSMLIMTVGEFLKQKRPARPCLIGSQILPVESCCVVGGLPKVGKSLFVIQMAVDLALGRTFLGQYGVPEPAKVVYIQGEISDDQIEARLEAMKRGLSPAETQCLHERLLLLNTTDLKLSNPVDVEELVRMVAEVGDVRVLIIDPLIKFHSLEENSASEMQRLFDALDQLRSRLKVSVVIVHHHGHGRQDRDGATRLRGSTALFGYVDSALSLEAVGKGGAVRLTFELRNGANPDPVVLSRDMDTLCYAVEDGDANKKVTRRHIISCLEASGEEVPRKDLISMLSRTCKASHATVETAIKAAEDQHLIDCREGSGRGKPKFYRSLN